MTEALLEIKGLKKYFPIKKGLGGPKGYVKAVNGVDLTIYKGETLGIVGESGCGKSTTGRCILRLIEPSEGEINYQGQNIADLSIKAMRSLRKELQMVFQDPFSTLNPKLTIRKILEE